MRHTSRRALLSAVSVAAVAAAAMRPARAAAPVRVGSKLDAEAALLGTIILTLLDAGGIPTVNRLRLGTTKILRSAIAGRRGRHLSRIHRQRRLLLQPGRRPGLEGRGPPATSGSRSSTSTPTRSSGCRRLRPTTPGASRSTAMPPSRTPSPRWRISRAGRIGGGKVKIAASAEFVESPAALPSFQQTYGFKLSQDQCWSWPAATPPPRSAPPRTAPPA